MEESLWEEIVEDIDEEESKEEDEEAHEEDTPGEWTPIRFNFVGPGKPAYWKY